MGGFLDSLGRFGTGFLGATDLLGQASRYGWAQALANRGAATQDPALRAFLTQHPNWAPAVGIGTSMAPQSGGPVAGGEGTQYTPLTPAHRVPDLPPLLPETEAKNIVGQRQVDALHRWAAGQATDDDWSLLQPLGLAPPPDVLARQLAPYQASGLTVKGIKGPGGVTLGPPAAGRWVQTGTGEWTQVGPTGPTGRSFRAGDSGAAAVTSPAAATPAPSPGARLRPPSADGGPIGMHVQSLRRGRFGEMVPTYERDKPPTPIDEKTARSWAAGVGGVGQDGKPLKATPEQKHAGKRILNTIGREKTDQVREGAKARADVKLSTLTSTTQTMVETAPSVMNLVAKVRRDMQHVLTGPWAGRWQELWARKIGQDDPGFIQLRDRMDLLTTALQRMHVGARGGDHMLAHFTALIGTGQQSPANMEAALSVIDEYAQDKIGERNAVLQTLRGPGAGAPPPPPAGAPGASAPSSLPPGFSVQDVP